jgi:Subtilase family
MKSQEDIEKLLEGIGKAWPEDGSIIEEVMRTIESAPVRTKPSIKRMIILKSLIAIAVSVAIFAAIWWGVIDNHNSLYAQVMDAVHKARTLHGISYMQDGSQGEPKIFFEMWFAKDVGLRTEKGQQYLKPNKIIDIATTNGDAWNYDTKENFATHFKNNSDKIVSQYFDQLDQAVQKLQDEYERYPIGDKVIDGKPCKAYMPLKLDKYPEPLKSDLAKGKRRKILYVDQQISLFHSITQIKENGQYRTEHILSFKFDEPFDPALFQPNFGKDVKIVDGDKVFDEFTDVKKAVYSEERDGFIFTIHRIERFVNGGVMFVSSVRETEETLKIFPLQVIASDNGQYAKGHVSCSQGNLTLALAVHQGVDILWQAVLPQDGAPDYFEVAPDKIKLHVKVDVDDGFRKSLTEEQRKSLDSGWNIVVNAPRPKSISTVEKIARDVYSDFEALKSVQFKWFEYPIHDKNFQSGIGLDHINVNQYVQKIVREVKQKDKRVSAPASIKDDMYATRLSSEGKLEIVRHPSAADFSRIHNSPALSKFNPDKIEEPFQVDARSRNLSEADLSNRLDDLLHAHFDDKTVWSKQLPQGFDPKKFMELGKNPGLGIRELHKKGITGKGVGIAILDQPLLVDHVEYKDRLKMYEEIHWPKTASEAQMHGPAVASIAVGKNVGVAPGADLYFIAEMNGINSNGKFEFELSGLAKSIDRIVEVNKLLKKENRIRVISISLGVGPDMNGYELARKSMENAEKQDIYVITCSDGNFMKSGQPGFYGLGRDPLKDPDDYTSFGPCEYWKYSERMRGMVRSTKLLVPMDSRCTASPTGDHDYVFYSTGGMSWTTPYIAGLYALACQVKPEVTPEIFWNAAEKTRSSLMMSYGEIDFREAPIVNPQKLLEEIGKAH